MKNTTLRPKLKLSLGQFLSFIIFISLPMISHAEDKQAVSSEEVTGSAEREVNKHSVGIGVGETFLFGRYENFGDSKITGDFYYSYSASYSFDLVLNAHSSSHQFKDDSVWLRGYTMSIKGRPYEFDSFSPYYLAGLGFYTPQIEDDTEKSRVKTTFGFNLGTGVDLRLNRSMTVGILGHLHKPFDIRQEEMATVSGSYFKLLITTSYTF
ncbi:hypothetical protein N9N67_03385 [Bacteriovoracaceae bacterium]|nr:hypothetical protein [Bacteriovoracaceae bacterium]